MIQLEAVEDGILLPVRALANARNTGIQGEHDGALKVSVTQVPEKGKANKAIVAVLAKQLKVRKSQITLHSGPSSTQKRFAITGIDERELRSRLHDYLQ